MMERSEPGFGARPHATNSCAGLPGCQVRESDARLVTPPEQFFGFQLGSDRKMARWDRIVEYFYRLESESDRIKVIEMGKSTEGNPFLLVIISSPDNLSKLEYYREINLKLTDPRGIPEEEIRRLVKEGKAIVCQSMSLHATEIGGTQMAPELAYDLLSSDSQEARCILDNVIFLMVPCFNPDGQIMVTDWYNRWLGTEYEGTGLPWLYHKYAGHDNNRDAFALNLPESRYMAKILFTDWRPHAYQDHHHMGSFGARLYIAPYSDAIRPYADPLVWREDAWYGAHMAYTLEEHGKTGVLNAAQYPGWGHFGFHWITTHHNIAGMLTESASAKLATPIYIHPHQLRGASPKTMPKYEAQTNFPHPWPGGWWRLRDIVEQQKIASWALLDICARFREKVLWNAYLKAKRQTERGASGKPKAYVIPARQHDPLTARKLVQLLLWQGIEIMRARTELRAGDRIYPEGSFVISLAQPKMGVIKSLLGRTFYPDSYWTRNPDGSPIMYDTATDTIAEYMGVTVEPVDECIAGDLEVVSSLGDGCDPAVSPSLADPHCSYCKNGAAGSVADSVGAAGYILDPRLNDSFIVVNRALARGVKVLRLDDPVHLELLDRWCDLLPRGAFFLENSLALREIIEQARELGVPFFPVTGLPEVTAHEIANLRVGMYQRYWGGNIDEGWTRLVLERFEFPYVTLKDQDFKAGNLREKVDAVILPSDRPELIIGPDNAERGQRASEWPLPPMPPEYRSGIGKEGVRALKEFVNAGGRLIAIDAACNFAIEACELKVKNVVANLTWKDFYCHGSTLRAIVHNDHPLAYGMPHEVLVFNWSSPTFEITEAFSPDRYEVVVEYPEKDLLQSGWLIGEDRIARRPCMLLAKCGSGQVVLIGFRAQFRAQTHGTFKFLFNCLYGNRNNVVQS